MQPAICGSEEVVVRGPQLCQCQGGKELGIDGKVNIRESLQRRHRKQAKDTAWTRLRLGSIRLNQKVRGPERDLLLIPFADVAPPAYRRHLTHRVTYAEHGKPVVLSSSFRMGESKSQDKPMGQRVKEVGESEGWGVMSQIGTTAPPVEISRSERMPTSERS